MFDFKALIQALFGKRIANEGVHDLRSATQMLRELPESDMLMAQVEIIQALQQLNRNVKISAKERFRTIPYLDEKARSLQAHLVSVYHGKIIDKGAPLSQVLLTITAFWSDMGNAYQLCLKQAMHASGKASGSLLPLFTLRAMRYYFEHARWSFMRYMELDSSTWRRVNRLYFFADQQGYNHGQLQAYADTPHSSILQNYLKLLMLALASPEKMRPDQIELVAIWLDKWIMRLNLEETIRPHRHLFAVNIAGSSPPKRLRRDMVGENWRYWETDTLVQNINETLTRLRSGTPPEELGLPAESAQPANLDLMQNLSNLWSRDNPAPARKHERQPKEKNIQVVRGLNNIVHYLNQQTTPRSSGHAASLLDTRPASWTVDDESIRGLGVHIQTPHNDKLQTGEIVGVLPDRAGQAFAIGIVRRLTKQRDGQMKAGIETLAATPLVVNLTCTETDQPYSTIFLTENTQDQAQHLLFIPPEQFRENREFTLTAQDKAYRIRLAATREHTKAAILAGFSVLAKISI